MKIIEFLTRFIQSKREQEEIAQEQESALRTNHNLKNVSQLLTDTASHLRKTSVNMGRGVTDQIEAVQSTYGAMVQMSASTEESLARAKSSLQQVTRVNQQADVGRSTIALTVDSMKAIESANQLLQSIVTMIAEVETKTRVIDDIMFQTRLLSFNAAVEASRAGEAGRGFEVVASAMRELAVVCTTAATDIRDLVTKSKHQTEEIVKEISVRIDESNKVTGNATEVFSSILDSVSHISKDVESIFAATQKQESSIIQCTEAMARVYASSTSNRKLSDEAEKRASLLLQEKPQIDRLADELTDTDEGSGSDGEAIAG